MDVRSMGPEDLEGALTLWARTEHVGAVPREDVERLLAHDPDLVLVAVVDGEVVAVVLGAFDGRRGWINRLAVDAVHRRTGVARALVTELERRLAARGCPQANLLVYADNGPGRALWESLGYDVTEQVVLYHRRLDGDGRATGTGGAC